MLTTEQLEKKLKISKYTCIHCPTLELAKQTLNIFHQLGLTWWKDDTHYTLNHSWNNFKKNTIYHPFDGDFTSLEFADSRGYKTISAENFIVLHTERKNMILSFNEFKSIYKPRKRELPTEGETSLIENILAYLIGIFIVLGVVSWLLT